MVDGVQVCLNSLTVNAIGSFTHDLAVNRIQTGEALVQVIIMMIKSWCPITDPCIIPDVTGTGAMLTAPYETNSVLPQRKATSYI